MKKRGSKNAYGHLEMIIAFTLFVGFVGFLVIFVRPSDNSTLSDSVATALKDSFLDSVKTNYTRFFVSIKSSSSDSCFSIDLDERTFKYPSTGGFVERAIDGARVDSKIDPEYKITANSGKGSYYVSISPEFDTSGVTSFTCSLGTDYALGSIDEKNLVSRKGLDEIKGRYENDYNSLRAELGLPVTFDFAIVSDDLPEINMDLAVPDNSEVVAVEASDDVLFSDGEVRSVRFIFKVW